MNFGWIDPTLLRDFRAEGTDSHRLCTIEDGWVERFGQDILNSFKRVLSRERLVAELQSWTSSVGFDVGRIFARFVPRKNEQREPPRLIFGDPGEKLQTIATERHLKFGIDFGTGYSPGLFLDQRENRRYVRHISPKRVLNCFAYNCSALREHALEVMGRYCLKATRRAATFHRPSKLLDFPPGAGASSIWLTLR